MATQESLLEITLTSGAQVQAWFTEFELKSGKLTVRYLKSSVPRIVVLPLVSDIACVTVIQQRKI